MSSRTAYLAKLFGLYLIAVSFAMFARPQATVEIMKAIMRDPPLLFIAGVMGVTAGLAIVLAHNVWSGGALPVIVTLFGWVCLIKGALLLVLSPETQSRVFMAGLNYQQYPNLYAAFALRLGACLTYAGFRCTPRSSK
jgi:vacuolar-type H+-ATPase subunit I/STV1